MKKLSLRMSDFGRIAEVTFLLNFRMFIKRIFAMHPILSSFYFLCFSRQFDREHQSVLRGQLSYQANLKRPESNSILMRRNIHRLEKGLIMRPKKPVFALGYIEETILCFQKVSCITEYDKDEYRWAVDVLEEYFNTVEKNDELHRLWEIFKLASQVRGLPSKDKVRAIPYERGSREKIEMVFDDFYMLCLQRRSIRWYEQVPVPNELIQQAVSAATLAPSACNRQPFRFEIFNDSEEAHEVAEIAMGTAGFSHNLPCLFVVVGDLGAYPFERDRHTIYIDGALASMQLMLAFETLGLASCPINWPDIDALERKMSNKLQLESHERPILLIAVGYADEAGMIPWSQKKSVKTLIGE